MHGGAGRPTVVAPRGMVASGHPLASAAGLRMLHLGGNAFDAGVAAGLVLNVVHTDMCTFGGVAPAIVYEAATGRIETLSGVGRWPRAASVAYFREHHGGVMPEGLLRCVMPAAPDVWFTILERYGTLPFGVVAQDAIELAEQGFGVHEIMTMQVQKNPNGFGAFPLNRSLYFPKGRPVQPGERMVQRDLARGLRWLSDEEARYRHQGREQALRAARDLFYRGEIARQMVDHSRELGGLFTLEDMADFAITVEPAIRSTYKEFEIFACGPWCQGPALPMVLNLLEQFDLRALGHGTPAYYHVLAEAVKLTYADREAFIGDPDFVRIPLRGMLSKAYARSRAALIRMDRAHPGMAPPGDPWEFDGVGHAPGRSGDGEEGSRAPAPNVSGSGTGGSMPEIGDQYDPDTSYVSVVDRQGNMFSCTPSDGYGDVPIIPNLGFSFSKRGLQSWMEPEHPSSVAPWKRPRLTPNPVLIFRQGEPWMAMGSPGMDMQVQAMVQAFVGHAEFALPLQAAIEFGRIGSFNYQIGRAHV